MRAEILDVDLRKIFGEDGAPGATGQIPITALRHLYRHLSKGEGRIEAPRLALAEHFREHPDELVKLFDRSVARFATWDNREEPFYSGRKPVGNLDHSLATRKFADQMERELTDRSVLIAGSHPPVEVTYVDRELVPVRKTRSATFEDGTSWRKGERLDLLLATQDRRPVVCEVKIEADRDPFYGLVQALSLAAQLATEPQRDRLTRHHDYDLTADGPIGCLVIVQRQERAAKHWPALNRAALELVDKIRGPLSAQVDPLLIVTAATEVRLEVAGPPTQTTAP